MSGRICDVLRNLVPFVHFRKHEKHPWRTVTFNKVVDFTYIPRSILS